LENIRTILFGGACIHVIDVERRTDEDKLFPSVGAELNVSRPVARVSRQVDDVFRRATRLQIAIPVGKAHHRVGVPSLR
jgi:hypothetical protein